MQGLIIGLVLILVGLVTIFFRKWIVRGITGFQYRVFGLNYKDKETISYGRRYAILWGAVNVIAGILSLLGFIKWR